jgi:hypothetical protein
MSTVNIHNHTTSRGRYPASINDSTSYKVCAGAGRVGARPIGCSTCSVELPMVERCPIGFCWAKKRKNHGSCGWAWFFPSPQHRRQGLLSRKSESGPTRGGSGGALIDALID